MNRAVSGPWALVRDLQSSVALPAVGPRVFGRDETLEVLIDGIRCGNVPTPQQLENLCANRTAKHRHRRRLAAQYVREDAEPFDILHALDVRRAFAFARGAIAANDFRLLLELAESSYEEVAAGMGLPLGTVKARAARARARVRALWVRASARAA